MRKFIVSIPIFLFGILATYFLLGNNSGSYSLLKAYQGLFFAFMTIAYFIILLIYTGYQSFFKKKRFDFYPLISICVVVIIFFVVQQFDSEKYKSKIILEAKMISGNDMEKYPNITLILRENLKYSLNFHDSHYGCIEIGKYQINNDTLILTKSSNDCVKILDYQKFYVDTLNKKIMMINMDEKIDTLNIFEIK